MATTETGSITETARAFFDALDTGQGWEACSAYCLPDATFEAQAGALAEIKTIADYAEWMKGMMSVLPDGRYDMKSFGVDEERRNVAAYAVFHATHTGEGGPVEPTGKAASTDYVYVMEFDGDKVSRLTKIWNDGWALQQLGWSG
ncbi:MAG TPA: nuclear transport factor 2 family protein [Gaiellaceae bacterium]|nr:nuclear transport factor 2 family protein [Gaiellaceae bacterium]